MKGNATKIHAVGSDLGDVKAYSLYTFNQKMTFNNVISR